MDVVPDTFNSRIDNLRPIVSVWDHDHKALVWMRGTYRSMHDDDLDIVRITDFEVAGREAAQSE